MTLEMELNTYALDFVPPYGFQSNSDRRSSAKARYKAPGRPGCAGRRKRHCMNSNWTRTFGFS